MSDDILNELQNLDLSTVQTAMPILHDGVYEATVAEVKIEPNSKKDGNNVNIKTTLNYAAKGWVKNARGEKEDRDVAPGFPVYDTISLKETRKENGELKYDPRPSVARFMEGVLGSRTGNFFPLDQYIGRRVMIRVKTEESEEYGDKARIRKYTPVV
jgi:hypothetical protein